MWAKLVKLGQQVFNLTKMVGDNTLELKNLRSDFKKLGGGTRKLFNEMKLMKQSHKLELRRLEENYAAEIRRLEDKIENLEKSHTQALENAKISFENQLLKAVNQVQAQRLLSEGNSDSKGK